MSLDLYQDQIDDRLGQFRPTDRPEQGVFDGFLKGTGMFAMRNFARAGSAVDLAGAAGPIVKEALGVGRPGEVDQYFKEHDDIFGSAIKYWTPKPEEVGVAAEVAGGLLSTIPLVIASPAFAVGATYMGTAEELMQKGVSPGKAQAVGAAQAVGLGLGVWMPILGQNLWQRIFVGGAGFNTAQGIVLRGASGALLEGTPAGEEFKAFDGKALTLDALLGMAFGSFAHISPAQRAQSADAWERLGTWAGKLEPSQVDALAALRQAKHSNVDSAPGKLAGVQDVQAHVERVRTALDQLAKGDQVAVDDKPMPQFEPDAKREAAAEKRATALQDVAERVRKDEGLPDIQETEAPAATSAVAEPPPPRGNRPGEAAGAEANLVRLPDELSAGLGRGSEEWPLVEDIARKAMANGRAVTTSLEQGDIYLVNMEDSNRGRMLIALNRTGGLVGKLGYDIEELPNGVRFNPDVFVVPEWRRMGVANAMYDLAERTGAKIPELGQPGQVRTEEGQAFREARARPDRKQTTFEQVDLPKATVGGEAHPALVEAERLVTERPDLQIKTGADAEGKAVTVSAKDYLEQAKADAAKSREDARLIAAAAQCLMGII